MNSSKDQETLEAIVKKAWADPAFKKKLVDSPVSTIENFLGHSFTLPEGKTLSVVDQSNDSTIFINIPAESNLEDMELNEEELDFVSGGLDVGPPIIIKPINFDGSLF